MAESLNFRRVLLKISGEALMGSKQFGIDRETIDRIAEDIASAARTGTQIAIVVGGGNIIRGAVMAEGGMDRTVADHMGMLATVMNGLALREALNRCNIPARVLSALPLDVVCESYSRDRASHHLNDGRVVICVAGIGNPFFTTDTAAAERASELACDAILKATKVDGIYSVDPKKDKDAVRFDKISHSEAIRQNLKVMDIAAFALARDNKIPIIVFSLEKEGAISGVLAGKGLYTLVNPS